MIINYRKCRKGKRTIIITVLISIVALLCLPLHEAQAGQVFYKKLEKADEDIWAKKIIKVDDGYVILGGVRNKYDSSYWGYIIKINNEGEIVFEKAYGKKARNSTFASGIIDNENNIVLTGHVNAVKKPKYQSGSFSSSNGWIVKLKPDGNLIWDKSLQMKESLKMKEFDISIHPIILPTDVVSTTDGEILVLGNVRHGLSDAPIIWKLTKTGKIKWKQVIKTKQSESIFTDLIQYLPGMGFVICGNLISGRTLGIWVAKFDNNGKQIWEKRFSNVGIIRCLYDLGNGELLFASESESKKNKILLLSKLNSEGKMEWNKKIKGNSLCSINKILRVDKGGIIALGSTCDNEKERLWIARISKSGELEKISKFFMKNKVEVSNAIPDGINGFVAIGDETEKTRISTWVLKATYNIE